TQHNTTQHNTTQHNTTQHNTTQHNTTQHNTTLNTKLYISLSHILNIWGILLSAKKNTLKLIMLEVIHV
ncbi:hypothetical protein, partial [Brachyspira innocens]|uniref:hypothetical protein n=1 Tax=Brachyspira innocens TaxID=13264 RepID=UPI001B7FCADE